MKNLSEFKYAVLIPALMFIAGFCEMYQHGFEQLAMAMGWPVKYVELFRGFSLGVTILVSLLVKLPPKSFFKISTLKRKRKPKEPAQA